MYKNIIIGGRDDVAIREMRYSGDPVLREKCKKVDVVDDRVRGLLDDMLETLHATEDGAAVAANQLGILERLVVIDYCGYLLKLVNPEIINAYGTQECIEGCLSFPGRLAKTLRPHQVTIKALNENGQEIVLTGAGEMAKCFCHELEHLDGKVFLDEAIEEFEDIEDIEE